MDKQTQKPATNTAYNSHRASIQTSIRKLEAYLASENNIENTRSLAIALSNLTAQLPTGEQK